MATPSCSFANLLTGNKLGCKIFRGVTGHAFEGHNSLAIRTSNKQTQGFGRVVFGISNLVACEVALLSQKVVKLIQSNLLGQFGKYTGINEIGRLLLGIL